VPVQRTGQIYATIITLKVGSKARIIVLLQENHPRFPSRCVVISLVFTQLQVVGMPVPNTMFYVKFNWSHWWRPRMWTWLKNYFLPCLPYAFSFTTMLLQPSNTNIIRSASLMQPTVTCLVELRD